MAAMTARTLDEIYDLAQCFVPRIASDHRFVREGARSWRPAHEIGHFLVASSNECRRPRFGIDVAVDRDTAEYRYAIVKEIAAMSVSQRLLRKSGHVALADDEIDVTDEETIECSCEPWCRRDVQRLLRESGVARLPPDRGSNGQLACGLAAVARAA